MRVADRAVARNYLKHLHGSQAKYAETNSRIASGNRFTKLSDDVSAGARVLRSRMDRYKAEKQLENVKEANYTLKVTEDNLMAMNTLLTVVHESRVTKALNDPTGDDGRTIIAAEIRSMMAEFLQYANANYGNKFVYGSSNAFTAPFTVEPETGKLLYNGMDLDKMYPDPFRTGQFLVPGNDPLQNVKGQYGVLDAGGDYVWLNQSDLIETSPGVFAPPAGHSFVLATSVPMDEDIYFDIGLGVRMTGPEVNPATAFKLSYSGPDVLGWGVDENGNSNNAYNMMAEIVKNLETFNREETELWNMKLREFLDQFRVNLTDIGVKTNFLDAMDKRLTDSIDNHTEKIDGLMGVKDAEEATNQMMNDYVLKAILQMGSRILPLSLMDFVR